MRTLGAVVRAGEWWDYKLLPALAMFYATAVRLDEPLAAFWPAAIALIASLGTGAAYVSIINDLTDKADDLAAGKTNRLAGRSRATVALLLAGPLVAAIFFFWLWRDQPLLSFVYLVAWLSFSLYSIPPVRLKIRGFAGMAADACGSHLCPTLMAALLVYASAQRSPDIVWLCWAGVWATAYGLRGILWHQLMDAPNDRRTVTRTFVQRHGETFGRRLGLWVVFPVEVVALAALLFMLSSPMAVAGLAVYGLLVAARLKFFDLRLIVVSIRPRFMIAMNEYYEVFLPLSLLLASVTQHPGDAFILLAHILLFPGRLLRIADDVRTIVVRHLLRRLRSLRRRQLLRRLQ